VPQTLDIRMARAAKAEARARRDPTQARHRSLLRARAALCALLREGSAPPDADRAFAGALQLGDAAAVELASIPDAPGLRKTDEARLARDHTGVEEAFQAQLVRLVRQYREGRELDPANASPAELLAALHRGHHRTVEAICRPIELHRSRGRSIVEHADAHCRVIPAARDLDDRQFFGDLENTGRSRGDAEVERPRTDRQRRGDAPRTLGDIDIDPVLLPKTHALPPAAPSVAAPVPREKPAPRQSGFDAHDRPSSNWVPTTSLHKLANARGRALVDQSRAIIPRPACGESPRTAARRGGRSGDGVRSVLATAASTNGAESGPSPASRAARGSRPLPASGER
jgi:hypothetical protein